MTRFDGEPPAAAKTAGRSGLFAGRDPDKIYRQLKAYLRENGIEGVLDSRVIFQKVFGRPHGYAGERPDATDEQLLRLELLLQKRISGYPLQYIAGSWPFLDFELIVGEGVLIPRPETETAALLCGDFLKERPDASALDLCAGTGCIAIAMKRAAPSASIAAVEYFPDAFQYLQRNIAAQKLDIRAERADVFRYQNSLADGCVDLVVSNPPYVSAEEYKALQPELYHEPRSALLEETGGLRFFEHIAAAYRPKLKPGGRVVFEAGDGQAERVAGILRASGYSGVSVAEDMFRNPRVVSAEK